MKIFFRALYSILLFGAGALHFVHEKGFRKIVPEILPLRRTIVLVTGVFEMIFSILLWVKKDKTLQENFWQLLWLLFFQQIFTWLGKKYRSDRENKRIHGRYACVYLCSCL